MSDKSQTRLKLPSNIGNFLLDNVVTLLFLVFTIFGFMVSEDSSFSFLLSELSGRVFRNAFLVLSLIIPVVAGLGLNFGIVLGAMAGQAAIIMVRYFNIGGLLGIFLCIVISVPISVLLGLLTGKLYNKTRGQEMIASLIVGFFADGIYSFIFLFAVGVIIPVSIASPLINPSGIGLRATVDMGSPATGGLGYVIDNICKVQLMWAAAVVAVLLLIYTIYKYFKARKAKNLRNDSMFKLVTKIVASVSVFGYSLYQIVTDSELMIIKIPVVTGLLIVALCVFSEWIMKTKLGQDFRSVGFNQNISGVSGINVDKRRIQAVIFSTVFAAWGQIIFLQNMGTLNTYAAHSQIGMFSVASLLVGGASMVNANYKHALIGTILFNAMFIVSPEIGKALFSQVLLGEYFRSFMVYGVIGFALGLYIWKTNKGSNKLS